MLYLNYRKGKTRNNINLKGTKVIVMTNEERNVFEQFGYTNDSIKTEYLLELAEDATKKLYILDKTEIDLVGDDAYECAVNEADKADQEYSENAWDIWCYIVRHIINEEIQEDKSARAYFLSRCNWRNMTELYFTSGVEAHRLKDEEELNDNWADLTREMFIGFFIADVIIYERSQISEERYAKHDLNLVAGTFNNTEQSGYKSDKYTDTDKAYAVFVHTTMRKFMQVE